ncbi:hypothetical protein RJG79_06790 [Mycoplasmatota bacterium WC44]
MEHRIFRYIFLILILFVGVSMGNNNDNLQNKINDFEEEIQTPHNDYSYNEMEMYDTNIINDVAKKSEKVITNSLELLGEVVSSVFGTLFR